MKIKYPRNFDASRNKIILNYCKWKKVLHIGCCDWPYTKEKYSWELWPLLYREIDAVCSEQLWIDLDYNSSDFLNSKKLKIKDISKIYVNHGPGSFAGIRNSLAIVKAINLAKNIDYYCFSFKDFIKENNLKYENIPTLCDKFNIKKNLIKPIYIS